ncbi:VOC family protein [Salinibacillus xinjiangensis]|uniref:Glyoxalase n=1 Tax=Salinibacillus xinjiangensis TaxID=1229268 RepID=A0A6G1XBP6_9BACI|nr:VOC family protein [Salinibacillus xinjiangensis]MRG88339.1 glyoxalase [Salinibacillus xinjiangensis]
MEKKFFQAPTIYVGEVNINVTDLGQSLEFYQHILGFKVLRQTDSKAVLTADGKTPLLTIEQPEDVLPKQARTTGLFHFAILLPSRSDLSAFLRHIVQTKFRYGLGASDHYVSEAIYLSDPDGNGIEVYRDRPSSEWNWSNGEVEMATVELDAQGLLAESTDEWKGMPNGTIMGHIHLHVSDLKTTEDFYVNGLGFDIITTYPGALFASTGGYHHHLGLNVWNGTGIPAPPENSVGLNWYTLIFPDEESRAKVVTQLKQKGMTVNEQQDRYAVKDPSGNLIHLNLS